MNSHQSTRSLRQFPFPSPQWRVEEAELDTAKRWETLKKALGDAPVDQRLAQPVLSVPGAKLLDEVEGRLLYTLARDYQMRQGGVLERFGPRLRLAVREDRCWRHLSSART